MKTERGGDGADFVTDVLSSQGFYLCTGPDGCEELLGVISARGGGGGGGETLNIESVVNFTHRAETVNLCSVKAGFRSACRGF